MTKRLNHPKRCASIIPANDMSILLNVSTAREYVANMKPTSRHKIVAFLYSIYSAPELVNMLGIKASYVHYCAKKHKDLIEAAQLGRNFAIADLSERRVIELLQTMDVGKISDDKKPQSVKYLMDSADIARVQINPETEEKEEDVAELIFRIRQKMKPKEPTTDNEETVGTDNEN